MALFSFSGQIISRGKSVSMSADGGSGAKSKSLRSTSVAAAAYRSESRLVDKASGRVFDYTRKSGVVYTEIMLPENALDIISQKLTELILQRNDAAPELKSLENELRMWLSCENYARELLGKSQRPTDLPDFSVKKNNKRMSELERIEQNLRQAAERKEHFQQKQNEKSPKKLWGLER